MGRPIVDVLNSLHHKHVSGVLINRQQSARENGGGSAALDSLRRGTVFDGNRLRKGDAGIIPGVATVSLVVLAAVGSVKADGNFIMEVPPADMTGLNVKVESVKGDGSTVVVSWNKSSDSTVVTNTVYYGPDSWHFTNSVSVAGIDTTNVTITGLASGVTYYFAPPRPISKPPPLFQWTD